MKLCKCSTPWQMVKTGLFYLFFPVTIPFCALDEWLYDRYFPDTGKWKKYFSPIICMNGQLYLFQSYYSRRQEKYETFCYGPDRAYSVWEYSINVPEGAYV